MARFSEITTALARVEALLARIADGVDAGRAEGLAPSAAAQFIGVSLAKLHDMNAHGLLPAPADLGDRCPRWSRGELVAWLRAGTPGRARWNLMRDTALRRAG
jgi:predicted DNA-binding transcriptional regulator AlpA